MQIMSDPLSNDSSYVYIKLEPLSPERNVCVWCETSLFSKRTHSLPEGRERRLISERISPRDIPDGGLLCYRCWTKARKITKQEAGEVLPKANTSSACNSNTCVWCRRSLSKTQTHSLPEGPERNEIVTQIHPREIPPGGRVCYACWVAARRKVQKANNADESRQDPVSAHKNHNVVCTLCNISLFRRKTHTLPNAHIRDEVAARIYPRQLSGRALLCTNCWIQVHENLEVKPEYMQQPITIPTMELDEFTHTSNSSRRCFVPQCANTERLRVPEILRKRILISQNVFVTENARICKEHITLYDWQFLDKHEFSRTFTKKEMESMLRLSIKEFAHDYNFENINAIDDNVFVFLTGLSKEKYFDMFNQIRPALTCNIPHTALAVYLIKARTGDSHEKISSLLSMSKSSITRLVTAVTEALNKSEST